MKLGKRLALSSLATFVLAYTVSVPFVYADSFGVVEQSGNGYGIIGGDTYAVNNVSGSAWAGINGQTILLTHDLVDGQQVIQGDIQNENMNNGYVAIYPSDVSTWVSQLKGNSQWVQNQVTSSETFSILDDTTFNTTQLVPFMDVANQSGAIVGSSQYVPTGQTGPNGKSTYVYEVTLDPSNPPTPTSFTASVSGGGVTFNTTENVPLWNQLAKYHYISIQVTNNGIGQSQWVVGSGNSDRSQMQYETGTQGTQTDSITANLSAGSYTAAFWIGDGVDRIAGPLYTNFTIGTGTTPTVTLNANPTSLNVGSPSTLTATAQNVPADDYIAITDQSGDNTLNGKNQYEDYNAGETSLTVPATDNQAQTVTYIAQLFNKNTGLLDASSAPVQVTWNNSTTSALSIQINPQTPVSLNSGQSQTIYYSIYGGSTSDYGHYHVVITPINSQNITNAWNNPNDVSWDDSFVETEYPANGASSSVSYEAQLVDNDTGQTVATSTSASITWSSTAPSFTFTANPTNLTSGQATQLQYSVTNEAGGDYVTIQGSGGQDMWSETKDTDSKGTYSETETPINGATTQVTYIAELHDMAGDILSTQTATITWISYKPVITMSALPTSMVPGQPSTIFYQLYTSQIPYGDYVGITGSGNAQNPWNATNLQTASGQHVEVENPSAGQTISETYTGTIYDPAGNPLSTASVAVQWVNSWTGTVQLSANPQFLPTGQSTNLAATASQPIPSGYTLNIVDETTGQMVSSSQSAPETSQYTSYNAETDSFMAYVSDGYEQVGTPSNTVEVTWSQLSLSANPQQLPVGSTTTLTVSGANVPQGDYLVLYNASTGQIVGYSQSTPYSVNQSEPTAQTDEYIAYINSVPNSNGAPIVSNTVDVDWYGVTLTANPTQLPVNKTSLLTATAQNLPNGYVVDILDQTSNQVIATGQPGQMILQAFQTKSQVETDKYVAQIVQPSNPPIPGLITGPAESKFVYGMYDNSGTNSLASVDTSTGAYTTIPAPPSVNLDFYIVNNGIIWSSSTDGIAAYTISKGQWNDYPSPLGASIPVAYDSARNSVIAVEQNDIYNLSNGINELSLSSGQWSSTFYLPNANGSPVGFAYVPGNDSLYVSFHNGHSGDSVNYQLYQYAFSSQQWTPIGGSGGHGVTYGLTYDPANGDLLVQTNSGYGGYWYQLWNPNTQAYVGTSVNEWYNSSFTYDAPSGNFYLANSASEWSGSNYYTYPVQMLISSGNESNLNVNMFDLVDDPYQGGLIGFYDPANNGTWATPPFYLSEYSLSTGTVSQLPGNITSDNFSPIAVGEQSLSIFPYWTFSNMPSYIPSNLFTQPAAPSPDGYGFWVDPNAAEPNGTAWFESTFNTASNESVNVTMPAAPTGFEVVYIDGKPVLQDGNNPAPISGVPVGQNTTVTLPEGTHQVVIEGVQTNNFQSNNSSPAHLSLQITDSSGTLVANSANSWHTTGYITQLPSGWFSGAVGTWNFTEYVLQENQSQPISQQQSYTLTTTAQNVSATSLPVTVSWTDSGYCPAPYDSDVTWTLGPNGIATLTWYYNVSTPQFDSNGNFTGCALQSTLESATYNPSIGQGVISGLTYDPGTPNDMWLPTESSSWNAAAGPESFWGPLNQEHGWTGMEYGGPTASQISSTLSFGGVTYHTFGPGEGNAPWAYARAGSGFGIRLLWTGAPVAVPTSGTITYTMTNPDGTSNTWTKNLAMDIVTLNSQGTGLTGLNTPPPYATMAVSTWTDIPKDTLNSSGVPELAAWSLNGNPGTVNANSAQISVKVSLNTPAGTINWTQSDVITLFNYPAWYFIHLSSDNVSLEAQQAQQSMSGGTVQSAS